MECFMGTILSLEAVINKLEVSLNKPRKPSPFDDFLAKHGKLIKQPRQFINTAGNAPSSKGKLGGQQTSGPGISNNKANAATSPTKKPGQAQGSQGELKTSKDVQSGAPKEKGQAQKTVQGPQSAAMSEGQPQKKSHKQGSPSELSFASSTKSSSQFSETPLNTGELAKGKSSQKKAEPAVDSEEKILDDFRRCDLRVGEFKEVWKHPDSDYLYCEKIDIKREVREIASGLQHDIPIEGMSGKMIVFSNLKVKKLGGFPSNGMVLCSNIEQKHFELLRPTDDSQIGERVFLEGYEKDYPDEPEKILSSKVLERVLKHFKTDSEGYPIYNGIKLRTKAGFLKPSKNTNGNID